MNRQRGIPRQHRRLSLPSTAAMPLFCHSPSLPGGSDAFQRALEDLRTQEPDQVPSTGPCSARLGFNGLNNIQELSDESEDSDNEDEAVSELETEMLKLKFNANRRHSLPLLYKPGERFTQDNPRSDVMTSGDANDANTAKKKSSKNKKKVYFSKHRYWPKANANLSENQLRSLALSCESGRK